MKTNGLASRVISLLVTFVFLVTLVPTAVLADGSASETDYTMSLLCDNETVKAGETGTLTVKLDGPMADISFVQYSVEFNDEYALITADNERKPECFDQDWFAMIKGESELGYIGIPSVGINNGALNVTFLSTSMYYIDSDAPDNFYNATTTNAGVIKFTAVKDIENPAEVFTLINCKISHVDDEEATKVPVVQIPDKAVANVISLIDAIGTAELTDACLGKITEAETAYGSLSDAQKAKVTNYSMLTEARTSYDALVKEAQELAAEVDALIDAIGDVTLASEQAIINAQNKYNELKANQQKYVTKKEFLDDAAAEYERIRTEAETAAANVDTLINAIGEVTLDSGDKIKAARNAYDDLEKNGGGAHKFVTKLSVLQQAEATYTTLVNNKKIADEVIADIEAIGEVSLATYDTVKIKIQDARDGYTSLVTGGIENLVDADILKKLTDAEEELKKVEGVLEDIANAEKLIDAIGTVTLNKGDKITAADEAYRALSAEAQEYVENKNVLESAKATYQKLKEEQELIDAVIDAIAAIGEVTLESEEAINNAKNLYTNLDDNLKSRVENKSVLDEAEAKLASLKRVKAVEEKIAAIGEVSLTSEEAIAKAKSAYATLTDDEKKLVSNYGVLEEAITEYDRLSALADKEQKDKAAAKIVDNMIAGLGEITLDSKDALEQAEAAYDNLTDDQRAHIQNLSVLQSARTTYDALVEDKNAIDAVDALILLIGEVEFTDESKQKIEDARKAYEALGDLKDRVTKYGVLEKAEIRYIQLGEINDVITLIEKIGEVSYTETCRKAIETAEEAYADLDDMLKPEIADEYAVLKEARKAYEALAPIASESGEVAGYGNNHVLVLTNIGKGMNVTVNGIEAKQIVMGDNVYYVLVTEEPIEEKDIVVDDTATQSEVHTLGDVNNDGAIDVIDAQRALMKAADQNVPEFENSIVYVKADVNGNGEITARDAYLIAMAILDPDSADSFKVYSK